MPAAGLAPTRLRRAVWRVLALAAFVLPAAAAAGSTRWPSSTRSMPVRTYAAGISNGGMMSMRLACEMLGRFAAIATVGANMPAALAASCRPAPAVPLAMFSGTADPLMPYAGGSVAGPIGGLVLAAPETAAFWAHHNAGASTSQTRALVDPDPGDGTTADLLEFPGDVALYRVNDGGHTWPGGTQYLPVRFVGKVSRDFNVNDVISTFFGRHALP